MSKFLIVKRISLAYLGDGWEECFISFSPLNFNDNAFLQEIRKGFAGKTIEEATEDEEISTESTMKMLELLASKFIEGKGFTSTGVVSLEKEDIKELPITVVNDFIKHLTFQEEPLKDPKG